MGVQICIHHRGIRWRGLHLRSSGLSHSGLSYGNREVHMQHLRMHPHIHSCTHTCTRTYMRTHTHANRHANTQTCTLARSHSRIYSMLEPSWRWLAQTIVNIGRNACSHRKDHICCNTDAQGASPAPQVLVAPSGHLLVKMFPAASRIS